MSEARFYNTVDGRNIDYPALRLIFPLMTWNVDPWHVVVDNNLAMTYQNMVDNGYTGIYLTLPDWERLYVLPMPSREVWEVIIPADPAIAYNGSNSRWEYSYSKRNMTELELEALNEGMRVAVREDRRWAYQERSDGIYWSSERNETTKQEWLDEVNAIKAEYPYPDPVVIPE